ncbi:oocyte zinc finger protein XlCOF28-like, partial [Hippocampus comes]|uniref:oocyte zinc finger protein XlCOF28-like n=1 Tax=Hippocampus comes TaxID=109280 RepID=UPI00094E6AFD
MCAKIVKDEEYEEDVGGPTKESERQLLDPDVEQPPLSLRDADVSEDLVGSQRLESPRIKTEEAPQPACVKEEMPDPARIKVEEEPEAPRKEDEREDRISKSPLTGIIVKSKGAHCGETPSDGLLAPLSDGDDVTSHSSDYGDEDDEQHSKEDPTFGTGNKCVKCSHFDRKSLLKAHTGENPYACSVCGKIFSRQTHLTNHTRTHTGDKPFVCPVCAQRFTTKANLKRHARMHDGEKPFTCSLCGKSFTQKGDLRIHMRTHTGEKPFVCPVCGTRFTMNKNRTRHMRTHTDEKPFACSVCGKAFNRKNNLKTHARIHVGEKPFTCSVCAKRFFRKDQLKKHKCAAQNGRRPSSGKINSATEKRGDHRVEMCTRRVKEEEPEEDLWGTKEEKEPQSQALCEVEPRVPSDPAVANDSLGPEWQEPEKVQIKDEVEPEAPEPLCVKEEEREDELSFPLACVTVKIEEGDGDHCGGSHSEGLSAPPSESENITSHSSDYDDDDGDDEHATGDKTCPTDAKRVKCSYCDKTFCRKSVLKVHTRKHTGERPFVCSVCGKGFIQKGALRAHVRTHTGEKPFA